MTEPNHRPSPDILEHAAEALRSAPVPPGPPAELTAATVAALPNRLADTVPAEVHRRERRRRIMRYVRYGSAASVAAGLLIAAGVLWLGSGSAEAFHRAADKAAAAKTIVCKHTQKFGDREMPFRAYYRADAYRMELLPPDGTGTPIMAIVADLKAGKGLQINITTRTVRRLNGPAAGTFPNLIEQFRKLKGEKAELVGEEKINGQPTKVYRVKDTDFIIPKLGSKDELRVWIDPKTELPVRVRADIRSSKLPQQFTWEDFRWNEKLDPKLFSLDVPKGYTVEGADKPPPPASEPETGPAQFIVLRRAMDRAAKAKSVRVVHNRGGKGAIEWTDYFQGEQFRTEVGHLIIVEDGTTKRRLEVNTDARTARVRDMTESELRELKRRQQNWLTEPLQPLIQNDKEYTVRELASERQNGRLIKVYQIDHMVGGKTDVRITLWADAKTELPIRARIERPKAKANPLAAETNPLSADELMNRNRLPTRTIEYEDWNKEFDAKLFSLEVPKGYRTSDHPLWDTEQPPEKTQFVLFRRAMDDAEKAKSFRAAVHMTMTNTPAGAPKAIEQKLFGQGDKMRIEFGDTMVSVADATAKKMLILNTKTKTAQTMPLNGPPSDLQKGVTAAVKKVLDRKEGVEDLGEKFLDGRKTHAYRVKGLSLGGMKADVTYWIDAKRDLPVRLEMTTTGPVTMTQSIDYLGFNEELDPKLFDMTVPKGYKVIEKPAPKK